MIHAVCCVPVSPLRADPSHRSEMVSQLLFGEVVKILEVKDEQWIRVLCRYDQYEGWCTAVHVTELSLEDYMYDQPALASEWDNLVDYNGRQMHIPLGSSLTAVHNGRADWRRNSLHYSGQVWDPAAHLPNVKELKHLAFCYLNTPYLWGGKSVHGVDCSGFTQIVFKFFGVALLRDSYQQALQGEVVGFLQQAHCGDLAFFDNAEGRITHVGILLNEFEIIHASGKVRVDKIDTQGILNVDTGVRTHNLRVIKRLF